MNTLCAQGPKGKIFNCTEGNMKLTVEDVCNFPEFPELRVIAGRGGLNNPIDRCGILDYEFVDGIKEKWYNTNFHEKNMIVVTSFLYAKDNEYLIFDAVKSLAARKCSGLIIKNIFRLPISDTVLRYADTMNFPIILIEGKDIYFEDLIVLISERAKQYGSIEYREGKAAEMLRSDGSHKLLEKLAYEINPTFRSDIMAMFFEPDSPSDAGALRLQPREYQRLEEKFAASNLASDSMFYYQDGFFIVHSRDMFEETDPLSLSRPFLDTMGEELKDFHVGISSVHHLIWQIKDCFEESLYAARILADGRTYLAGGDDAGRYALYDDLGIYKVILPYCDGAVMREFSDRYIRPLEDYDLETNGSLLETAICYVVHNGDLQKTADAMAQHKNTIRYRLKNISNVTGINALETKDYEILSMAVRIFMCNNGESREMRRRKNEN